MSLFRPEERELAETVSRLVYCNPFLPERVELERRALGDEFVGFERVLNMRPGDDPLTENVQRLIERVGVLTEVVRERLVEGAPASDVERGEYEDLSLFYLYHRHHLQFRAWIQESIEGSGRRRIGFYGDFERDARHLLRPPGVRLLHEDPPEHLFAFFFQLNRAFVNIYLHIVGGSMAAARLRGSIWQSIFTHDLGRYRRALYDRMGDVTTLITGPSGTGKELVARAVAFSRYIPFDVQARQFQDDFAASMHALNLSALSPTLIESELFGHRRGAFTGALQDRKGWFEICRPLGTVFLDEIGELDSSIQVKLLRVLQTRMFQRLGDTESMRFSGKILAATNRDLAQAMREGDFREDFYYRLNADMIVTASLRDQLGADDRELRDLVRFIAARMAGEEEADALTDEVVEWVARTIGLDYAWPGNFRELEQCVRNILIRKEYRPNPREASDAKAALRDAVDSGQLTADELLNAYCRLVHEQTGSYSEAARRLGLDRRTVKARVTAG